MGLFVYLLARIAGERLDELDDRIIVLEHEVKYLKRKLKKHGIQ